jgi:hypothetical protein
MFTGHHNSGSLEAMKDESLFPDDEPARLGRPKTSKLSRKEQLAEAQRRRREKLRSEGMTRVELFLDQPTLARIQEMTGSGEMDQSAAVILAIAKYDDRSTGFAGLSPVLANDLESLFPELDLGEALYTAAAKHVAEVKRKRLSSRQSRKKAKRKP